MCDSVGSGTDRLTPGSRKRTASDRSSGPDDSAPAAAPGVSKRRRTVKTMADGSVSITSLLRLV